MEVTEPIGKYRASALIEMATEAYVSGIRSFEQFETFIDRVFAGEPVSIQSCDGRRQEWVRPFGEA